jgi:hypothetical protein
VSKLRKSIKLSSALLLFGLHAACSSGGGSDGETLHTVTVSVDGSGTVASADGRINCGTQCSAAVATGGSLSLTATAAAAFTFQSWHGACAGSAGTTCTISVNQATNVAATFAPTPPPSFALSVTVTGNGSVTSNPQGINCPTACSANLPSGTSVTLTATASSGSTFSGWASACGGSIPSCTVAMSAATAVTANFVTSAAGWHDAIPVGTNNASDVQVVLDSAGNATLAWTQAVSNQVDGRSIFASRSIAGGAWSTPQEIDGNTSEVADKPRLAVDPASGRVMAIWITPSGLWGRAFAPETGWGGVQRIETHNTSVVGRAITEYNVAIDGVGESVAVWDRRPDGRNDISVWASRFVVGSGWTTPAMIETNAGASDVDFTPAVAMLANGNAVAVWTSIGVGRRGYWTNTFAPASGWATAKELVKDEGARTTYLFDVRADGVGNAVLAWNEFDINSSSQRVSGMFSKRFVAGAWESANSPVAPPNVVTGTQLYPPALAVGASGHAVLGWPLEDYALRVNVAAPGAAWGTPALLKPASSSLILSTVKTAVDGQGNAFAAWTQFVRGQSDPELWISRYTVDSGWGPAARHQTTNDSAGELAMAMNARGDTVIVWFESSRLSTVPSRLLSRFYR